MICDFILTALLARSSHIIGKWESEYVMRGNNCIELVIRRGKWRFQDLVMWEKAAPPEKCKSWFQRNIADEDPYQYEHLTVEQLVTVRVRHTREKFRSDALTNEIRKRLDYELNYEDREQLTKVLEL